MSLKNAIQEKYRSKLTVLFESALEWEEFSYWDRIYVIDDFMNDIRNLFLAYYQDHLIEVKDLADANENILKQALPHINEYIVNRVGAIESTSSYEDPPWEEARRLYAKVTALEVMLGVIKDELRSDWIKECMEIMGLL